MGESNPIETKRSSIMASIQAPATAAKTRGPRKPKEPDFIDDRIAEICARLKISSTPMMRKKLYEPAKAAAAAVVTIEAIAQIHSEEITELAKSLTSAGKV
jgi:hypothetical protein